MGAIRERSAQAKGHSRQYCRAPHCRGMLLSEVGCRSHIVCPSSNGDCAAGVAAVDAHAAAPAPAQAAAAHAHGTAAAGAEPEPGPKPKSKRKIHTPSRIERATSVFRRPTPCGVSEVPNAQRSWHRVAQKGLVICIGWTSARTGPRTEIESTFQRDVQAVINFGIELHQLSYDGAQGKASDNVHRCSRQRARNVQDIEPGLAEDGFDDESEL